MDDRASTRHRRRLALGLAAMLATFATACQPAPSGPTGSIAGVPLPLPVGSVGMVAGGGINDNGIVAGLDGDRDHPSRGVVWNLATGTMTTNDCEFGGPARMTQSGYVIGHRSGLSPCLVGPGGTNLWVGCVDHLYPCIVTDINESGTIAVGYVGNSSQVAVYWNLNPNGGNPTYLAGLGAYDSVAVAVDDSGTIFGTAKTPGGRTHPVRWDAATHTPTDLDPTGGDTYRVMANENEQLVGSRRDGSHYTWDPVNGLRPLSVPDGWAAGVVRINGAGTIAGTIGDGTRTVPAAWDETTGALWTSATRATGLYSVTGITSNDVLYGTVYDQGSGYRAFVVLPDTKTAIELGHVDFLDGLNAGGTVVFGVNNTGMYGQVTVSPNKPGNLLATPSGADVVVKWTASPFVAGFNQPASYDVFRDDALIATVGAAATTFTDAGPGSGTHRYTVLARNTAGVASTPALTVVIP